MSSMSTRSTLSEQLRPRASEETYIHLEVAIVDDAAFTAGSENLNLRSMGVDNI